MIAISDRSPNVEVEEREYKRLLGYPPPAEIGGRAAELAAWARAWYAEHGRPWIYARGVGLSVTGDGFELDGVTFAGSKLRGALERAGAHEAVLVAVGAGEELELEARRLWLEERPDEYFFLDTYGCAVVERLVTQAGARLCAWADASWFGGIAASEPGLCGLGCRRTTETAAVDRFIEPAGAAGCRSTRECSARRNRCSRFSGSHATRRL